MLIGEFKHEINEYAKKLFPHCGINVRVRKNLGQFISIDFKLIGDEKDYINGCGDNDLVGLRLMIHLQGNDNNENSKLPEKIKVEILTGWNLNLKPQAGSYMAIDGYKLGWRNKTARPELVLIHILSYLEKIRTAVSNERDKNNIYMQEQVNSKYFEGELCHEI